MDLLGAFFLITSICCLLLALQWGGITYPWKDSKVWGNILGFGLLISTFTAIQFWRGEKATLPPRIMLRQRTVFTCAFFSTFLAMALYTHIYYSKSSPVQCEPHQASRPVTSLQSPDPPFLAYLAPSSSTPLLMSHSTLLFPSRQRHHGRRLRHPHHPLPRLCKSLLFLATIQT